MLPRKIWLKSIHLTFRDLSNLFIFSKLFHVFNIFLIFADCIHHLTQLHVLYILYKFEDMGINVYLTISVREAKV